MITALVLQVASGNMDVSLFTFPVNILVMVVVLYVAFAEYRKTRKKGINSGISSRSGIFAALGMLALAGIIILAFPQFPVEGTADMGKVGARLGVYGFTRSWIFAASVLWVLIVLASYVIRAIGARKKPSWHANSLIMPATGLWLAVAGLFLGSPDMTNVEVVSYTNFATNIGHDLTGKTVTLPVSVRTEKIETKERGDGSLEITFADIRLTGREDEWYYVSDSRTKADSYLFKKGKWIVLLAENNLLAGSIPDHCVLRMIECPWYGVIYTGCLMIIIGLLSMIIVIPISIAGEKNPGIRRKRSADTECDDNK